MSEEVKVKMPIPMFEVGELERFDNNIHNIIEEYSKMMFKEKDQILTQRIIIKQEQEIKDLQKRIFNCSRYLKSIENHDFSSDIANAILSGNTDIVKKYLDREIEIYKEEQLNFTDEIKSLWEILGDKENE